MQKGVSWTDCNKAGHFVNLPVVKSLQKSLKASALIIYYLLFAEESKKIIDED